MIIVIPSAARSFLANVLARIDTHYSDNWVSVIVEKTKKNITLISGQSPFCTQVTLDVSQGSSGLKDITCSIDGSFFAQLLNYYPNTEQDIELPFEKNSAGSLFIVALDHSSTLAPKSKHNSESEPEVHYTALRRCECNSVYPDHITHYERNQQQPKVTASKSAIERVLLEANNHLPFEFVEFNKERQSVKIQRNGEVGDEKTLPKNVTLPMSLVLNPESTHALSQLCEQTSAKDINIAHQGDKVTFQTPECAMTCSLSGIEQFNVKKTEPVMLVTQFIVNIYAFKKEIEHCVKKYNKIKKSNDALILFTKNEAAISIDLRPYEFVHPFHVYEMKSGKESLYHFSPKALECIKIPDLTRTKKMKLAIHQKRGGELRLGFYRSIEDDLPFDTISLEKDDHLLPKIKKWFDEAKQLQRDDKGRHKKDEQADLFSYFDDED